MHRLHTSAVRRATLVAAASFAFPAVAVSATPLNYRTVAHTGMPMPGAPPLGFIVAASLNASGQVGITGGRLDGAAPGNGFWIDTNGAFAKVYYKGDALPGAAPGVTITTANVESWVDTAGEGVSEVFLAGSGVNAGNDNAFVVGVPGNLQTVVRTGNAVPDVAGATYLNLGQMRGNGSGVLSFDARLAGNVNAGNDSGIWTGGAGNVQAVAREGDAAPGLPAGVLFGNFPQGSVTHHVNDSGKVTFRADLTGTGVDQFNNRAIFAGTPGSLQKLVRAGDAAPANFGPGVIISPVNAPAGIDSAGRVAFTGNVFGPGITSANGLAAFVVDAPGSIRTVARRGDPVVGAPGLTFQNLDGPFTSGTGGILLRGTVAGAGVTASNNDAIFRETPAGVGVVLREGEQAPTLAPGVLFGTTSTPQLNAAGSFLFSSTLTGAGVTTANDNSLWLMNAAGDLTLVVRDGDVFQVNGADRTVSTISFFQSGFGPEGGYGRALDAADNVAFSVRFTDDTYAAFVVAVPEPASLGLLAAAAGCAALVRRRRA